MIHGKGIVQDNKFCVIHVMVVLNDTMPVLYVLRRAFVM